MALMIAREIFNFMTFFQIFIKYKRFPVSWSDFFLTLKNRDTRIVSKKSIFTTILYSTKHESHSLLTLKRKGYYNP